MSDRFLRRIKGWEGGGVGRRLIFDFFTFSTKLAFLSKVKKME
jgi:hypothetical protein